MSIFDEDPNSKLPNFLKPEEKPAPPTLEKDGYEFLKDTKKEPEPEVSIPEITSAMLEQAKTQLHKAISDPTINADAALAQYEHLEQLQSQQAAQRMQAAVEKAQREALNAEVSRKKTGGDPAKAPSRTWEQWQEIRR